MPVRLAAREYGVSDVGIGKEFAESSTFLSQAEATGQKGQPTGLWSLARLYPSFLAEFNVYQRMTSSGFKRNAVIQEIGISLPKKTVAVAPEKDSLRQTMHAESEDDIDRPAKKLERPGSDVTLS
jgi:hypothetical protein